MQDKDGNLLPDYEPLMDVNGFLLTKLSKGILGVAKRVTNLIFQEKGTCPDDFQMGVGIKTFLYEKANGTTLLSIEGEIRDQIQRYIQDVKCGSVEASYLTPKDIKKAVAGNTLVVRIGFLEPIEGKSYLSIRMNKSPNASVEISYFTD